MALTIDTIPDALTTDEKAEFFESFKIVYADPFDLTKMLNVPTGTKELPESAAMLPMFYPIKKAAGSPVK